MIYANKPAGTGRTGPVVDSCVLNLAVAKAIRNRRHALAAEILKSYAATSKEFHVACLACGPASEIFDVFEKAADKDRLQVSCIDTDREALSHGPADRRPGAQGPLDRAGARGLPGRLHARGRDAAHDRPLH